MKSINASVGADALIGPVTNSPEVQTKTTHWYRRGDVGIAPYADIAISSVVPQGEALVLSYFDWD